MPASERDRQILESQAVKLRIPGLSYLPEQLVEAQAFRQVLEQVPVALDELARVLAEKLGRT